MACVGMLLLSISCQEETTVNPENNEPTPYSLAIPTGFPKSYLSKENPLTIEGIQLGKMLYSDPILSSNGRSCSSCHLKENSFSLPIFNSWSGTKISVPPHVNLAFRNKFNWTGSEHNLDTLAMGDFEPEFFNTKPDELYKKLSEHSVYPSLFKKAFGINKIEEVPYHQLKKTIAMALAQHIRTMISANSKFDKFKRRELSLNQMEHEGYVIFFSEKGDCFHCHSDPLFSDQEFHNTGLNISYNGSDKGLFNLTQRQEDMGKFLSPTLRNIEFTAPYMHDGRFSNLEQVIDHYNEGVSDDKHVDPLLNKRNGTRKLNLTPIQKQQLIAFLKALSDWDYIK